MSTFVPGPQGYAQIGPSSVQAVGQSSVGLGKGDLQAVLEKAENDWKVWAISISVPPNKLGDPLGQLRRGEFLDTANRTWYTLYTSSSLALPWRLPLEWAALADQRTQLDLVANRLMAGLAVMRLAFLFSARGSGTGSRH